MERWESETEESPETQGPASLVYAVEKTKPKQQQGHSV